jgi:hypothetical protein
LGLLQVVFKAIFKIKKYNTANTDMERMVIENVFFSDKNPNNSPAKPLLINPNL